MELFADVPPLPDVWIPILWRQEVSELQAGGSVKEKLDRRTTGSPQVLCPLQELNPGDLLYVFEMHIEGVNPASVLLAYDGYVTVREVDGPAFLLETIGQLSRLDPSILSLVSDGKCIHEALYGCYS